MPVKKAAPVRKTTTKVPANKAPAKKAPAKKVAAKAEPVQSKRTPQGKSDIGRIGNVGSIDDLRFSNSGVAVCSFSLAYTPYNFETKEQGETIWYKCIAFNQLAENVAQVLEIGMRVVVVGRPQINEYQGEDGETHSVKEILLNGVGPDLRFALVTVNKINRNSPSSNTEQGDWDEEPF